MKNPHRTVGLPPKKAVRSKADTGKRGCRTLLDAQAAKLAQWLAENPIDLDHYRIEDERRNMEFQKGSLPLPKAEVSLIRKVFYQDYSLSGEVLVTKDLRNVKFSISEYGAAANSDAARFLYFTTKIAEAWIEEEIPIPSPEFLLDFAKWMSAKAVMHNTRFFREVATLLDRRAEGSLHLTKPEHINLKGRSGRGKQPYDLDQIFPYAVNQLLAFRVLPEEYDLEKPIRPYYITKSELANEIKFFQEKFGKDDPAPIAASDLSRRINQSGLVRFVRK